MYNQPGHLKVNVLSSFIALLLSFSFYLSIQSSLLATFLKVWKDERYLNIED
jgi:hypothetical protein